MSLQRWLIAFLLLDFVAFTTWVSATSGWEGFIATFQSPWGVQIAIDLAISLTLVCVWIVRDARARGVSPVPWVVLAFLTGSIGPLLYLTLRPAARRERRAVGVPTPQEV